MLQHQTILFQIYMLQNMYTLENVCNLNINWDLFTSQDLVIIGLVPPHKVH